MKKILKKKEKFYRHKFDILDEIDQFLDKFELSEFAQHER